MSERSIGELASAGGVSVETVRYYERRGLLPAPPRTPAGYRKYDDDALWRLQFVGRAKELGFTLSEIRELLGAGTSGSGAAVDDVLVAARDKLTEVGERLTRLTTLQCRLRQLVETCENGDSFGCVSLEVGASTADG
ncbi:MAG: putative transcriptional regulator, MerR family [Actinomycetia bacterium]|jgi:DNA-binding transcriptional MerR regulator|nr:putative transcriptional regulator, MerR family [Actinomycetes bacterium]